MFANQFRSLTLDAERTVEFTEAESKLLAFLAQHPGQILSRGQILDGISEPGSERNDRTIDFLVNRVRRKLEDDPKEPRFIATRYGGGYVWVAEKIQPLDQEQSYAHVVIGGIRGTEALGPNEASAHEFSKALATAVQGHLDSQWRVKIDPDFGTAPEKSAGQPAIQVELFFFKDRTGIECVVTCRSGASGRVYFATRVPIRTGAETQPTIANSARALGPEILANHLRSGIEQNLTSVPLPVAMHEAAIEKADARVPVEEMEPKLRALRAEHPDDPQLKLIYATHIHNRYVVRGYEPAMTDAERRSRDEAEIESLVLDALDFAQTEPHLAVMAAKLLYFVDQGYKSLALELADQAHSASTAIASSLAIVGQLRGFVGDTDIAIDYLTQADGLAEKGGAFERYLLVLICQALIAADRRQELIPYRDRIYGHHPLLRIFLEPIFTDPEKPSMRSKGAMLVMSRTKARALLSYLHYISARLFELPEHRQNALHAPVELAVRRFGRDILPKEVQRDVPDLLA